MIKSETILIGYGFDMTEDDMAKEKNNAIVKFIKEKKINVKNIISTAVSPLKQAPREYYYNGVEHENSITITYK